MTEYPWHQSLHLQNFTVFKDTQFEFVPGVNALVGENGTGKTHLMKAMYAAQLAGVRKKIFSETLSELFQLNDASQDNLSLLLRFGSASDSWAKVSGVYNGQEWLYDFRRDKASGWNGSQTLLRTTERPVFIPAIDMMGHTKAFLAAANEIVLDFDLTCRDIVSLLGLKRQNGSKPPIVLEGISELLGGSLDYDEGSSRFYLVTAQGRLPMPLVAEGLRKIATLVRLAQNGWLTPGTTLFWDEPEVNLNPLLMDEIVSAILSLTRQGIQVFLATHSYVILKELDLQAKAADSICYFALQRDADGTTVNPTDTFTQLKPNPILEQYASLYDRQLTRATGRTSKGEPVR